MPFNFEKKIFSNYSSRVISEERKPYLIAEIGLNHNKDMELASQMIEEAAKNGADAVKFQSYTTEKFIRKDAPNAAGLFSIFKQFELEEDEHSLLKKRADDSGVDFISTPLTNDWVEILASLRVPFFKIASGDLNNYLLLKETIKYNIPHIVSTGASYWEDIEKNAAFFRLMNVQDVIYLHCVSLYPADAENLHLETITRIRNEINSLAGFSDHSIGAHAAFGAAILGACVVEKHFTLDKNLPGPDHAMSAEPEELAQIREYLDLATEMKGVRTEPIAQEAKSDSLGKRSIYDVNGKWTAMRPRLSNLPRDADYFTIL